MWRFPAEIQSVARAYWLIDPAEALTTLNRTITREKNFGEFCCNVNNAAGQHRGRLLCS
jgi:hypothetical protein